LVIVPAGLEIVAVRPGTDTVLVLPPIVVTRAEVITLVIVAPGLCTVDVLVTVWSRPGCVTVLPLPGAVCVLVAVITLVIVPAGLVDV